MYTNSNSDELMIYGSGTKLEAVSPDTFKDLVCPDFDITKVEANDVQNIN